jgi:hypothetical protein
MSDLYNPYPMRQTFAVGTRVFVSATCGGWRADSHGVIRSGPETVQTVQGADYFYWVEFDVPQHDLSDDGPYYKAQILSRCITQSRADGTTHNPPA